jgi:hypothetical protein
VDLAQGFCSRSIFAAFSSSCLWILSAQFDSAQGYIIRTGAWSPRAMFALSSARPLNHLVVSLKIWFLPLRCGNSSYAANFGSDLMVVHLCFAVLSHT